MTSASLEKSTKCVICNEIATVGVRGIVTVDYVFTCPFHAGMLQMIFENLDVQNSVKWKPFIIQKGDTN